MLENWAALRPKLPITCLFSYGWGGENTPTFSAGVGGVLTSLLVTRELSSQEMTIRVHIWCLRKIMKRVHTKTDLLSKFSKLRRQFEFLHPSFQVT